MVFNSLSTRSVKIEIQSINLSLFLSTKICKDTHRKIGRKERKRIVLDYRAPRCVNPPDPSESGSWLRARQPQQEQFTCVSCVQVLRAIFPRRTSTRNQDLNSQVRLILLTDVTPEVENCSGSPSVSGHRCFSSDCMKGISINSDPCKRSNSDKRKNLLKMMRMTRLPSRHRGSG